MENMSDTETKAKTKIVAKTDLKLPPEYKVIFMNDDVTTVEFVLEMLITFFAYDLEKAKETTLAIHENGSEIIAVYPYEIAEQKQLEVTATARSNGFPLEVNIEPVS
jgi:ATP-dependent Clp protease adaptor protein ClpS